MTRRIVPIVEGHSEALSMPAFLRRVLHDLGVFDVQPDRAIRENRHRLVKHDVFINRVRMAEQRDRCAGILVVFDADDDAACQLGPELARIVVDNRVATPCRVVLAVCEVETWLIAGVESLRGYRGIAPDARAPDDPEATRGAKEWLDRHKQNGYKPTIDQLPLLLKLDYDIARRRAPSLDKFLRDLDSLVAAIR